MHPPSSLTSPRPAGSPAPQGGSSSTSVVVLPGAAERRAATNTRMAEEAFYQLAEKIATLPARRRSPSARRAHRSSTGTRSRPSSRRRRSPRRSPTPSSRCGAAERAARSPTSRRSTPDVAPEAPVLLPAMPLEGRICLDWLAPQNDVLGRPVEIGGYEVYRRILPGGGVRPAAESEADRGRVLRRRRSAVRRAARLHRARGAREEPEGRGPARPRSSPSSTATSIRRPRRRASTRSRRATACAWSGARSTRRTWPATSCSAPRDGGAGAPDEGPGRRSLLHRRDGRAGQALPLHRPRRRPGGQPEPPESRGGRRAVLTPLSTTVPRCRRGGACPARAAQGPPLRHRKPPRVPRGKPSAFD